ncbi:hypothetical protein IKP85_05820 [bacterium]|nr:hypothetical protein [bacterium]
MNISNSGSNNTVFSANILISGKQELLKPKQILELTEKIKTLGEKNDIVEFTLGSDIIDWVEVNKHNNPKKFLSGYKMSVETTIKKVEDRDLSVADTQQRFWEHYEELSPFGVLKSWINSVKEKYSFDNKNININPTIYKSKNDEWYNWASILTPDIIPNNISAKKNFFNSPFYKAYTGKKDTSLEAVFKDNLANNSHRINVEQLETDIADLKSGTDIFAPVLDFVKGITHPKAEKVEASKYIFIDGLQTQFPEIENLADLIIRMQIPENVRTERFISRASQLGTAKEQSQKDLAASNEYMKKLIPFNPNSADVVINGRYNKEYLYKMLQYLFGLE